MNSANRIHGVVWKVGILLVCSLPAQAEMRTWTSVEGKTLVGEFVQATAQTVTLRREDGRQFTLPLKRLSEADRQWVAENRPTKGKTRGTYSGIWGRKGERWKPESGTLQDFSLAGYHEGTNDFPMWNAGPNVRQFGAMGDGRTDDTEAFKRAIKACGQQQVVFIPNGTYVLRDWLGVDKMVDKWVKPAPKSHFVLRGESRDRTVLLLGVGLQDIHPWDTKTANGGPATQWSWWGGFLWFEESTEVGVENLTIKGSGKQYDIHWKDRGYNGVCFRNVKHAWVRAVTFVNVDCGVLTNNSHYVTVHDVRFQSTPEWPCTSRFEDNYGMSGHHALGFLSGSSWCLADQVVFTNRFHHELTVNPGSHHCVFSNIVGPCLHFDFHAFEDNIHDILFTQIDTGEGTLVWRNNFYGVCTGTVLWNIKGQRLTLPEVKPWVKHSVQLEDYKTLVVGWPTPLPNRQDKGRPWFESIPPDKLEPQNIYHAQRSRRLSERN